MEELDTGITFTVLSNTTEALLYDVHPFYTYECSVAAETIAIGPYSTQITPRRRRLWFDIICPRKLGLSKKYPQVHVI